MRQCGVRSLGAHATRAHSVRTPHSRPSDGTGRHPTFRTSCPLWRGSSTLPLVILTQVSQCSAGPHKPGPSGATPEPATAGYANWQSGEVESLVNVSSTLTPVTWRGVRLEAVGLRNMSRGDKSMVRFHPGSLMKLVCKCCGSTPPR